jgi:NAD(P)-dependent dehydrogenase (short-subunit alcohol dehydrogenase family)
MHACRWSNEVHNLLAGFAFVQQLVKRNKVVVFAGIRDPFRSTGLQELSKQFPKKLHIVKVKLVSADEAGNRKAVEEIKAKTGRLDVVITNAGKRLADA